MAIFPTKWRANEQQSEGWVDKTSVFISGFRNENYGWDENPQPTKTRDANQKSEISSFSVDDGEPNLNLHWGLQLRFVRIRSHGIHRHGKTSSVFERIMPKELFPGIEHANPRRCITTFGRRKVTLFFFFMVRCMSEWNSKSESETETSSICLPKNYLVPKEYSEVGMIFFP